MQKSLLLSLAAAFTILTGCQMADSTPQEVEVSADTTSAEAAFDAIKSLEGTWEGTLVLSDGREMPTSNEFKVVSGGNTVVETLIEGDEIKNKRGRQIESLLLKIMLRVDKKLLDPSRALKVFPEVSLGTKNAIPPMPLSEAGTISWDRQNGICL